MIRRLLLFALAVSASCTRYGPPLGNALIVVDTDSSVPKFVDRLRVDFYTEDLAWYLSRDVPAFKPSDWPVSFDVHLEQKDPAKSVILRLRAHKAGKVRPFVGERFYDRTTANPLSSSIPDPTPADPKTLTDGTRPATEPEPLLAIDRLVLVRLQPDAQKTIAVTLRAACTGTMADLRGKRTCVDTDLALAPLVESIATESAPAESLRGSFEKANQATCAAALRTPRAGLFEDEVCVPGGVFIFGSNDYVLGAPTFDGVPQRLAIVPPFRMDKFEVTVARFRQAIADGLAVAMMPIANDGPLAGPLTNGNFTDIFDTRLCTWTSAAGSRESYPLNCVSHNTASSFCKWAGGALPFEVQWEYAATAAGRADKTHFPWGDEPVIPDCSRVTYFRNNLLAKPCGFGPLPVQMRARSEAEPDVDVALGIDVTDLAGSMGESMADSVAPFSSECWLAKGLRLPSCTAVALPARAYRGGAWVDTAIALASTNRQEAVSTGRATILGFRCVRPGDGP